MKRLIPILLLVTVISCEERVNWPMDETITPRLVVEGIITNKPDLNYVQLSLPVSDPNSSPQPVMNATVIIASGNGNITLLESGTTPGLYSPEAPVTGVVGEGYRLYINVSGYEFLSGLVGMLPVSPMKQFQFREVSVRPGFYIINPIDEDEPSYTEYRVEYQNPEFQGDTIQSLFYTFTLRSIDVNQFFKPKAERLIFPQDAMIIRTKYSLAPGHERFVRALLSETEWNGGWFDVLPGNLHTNMNQGAVGYFGASSVIRDTVYFK